MARVNDKLRSASRKLQPIYFGFAIVGAVIRWAVIPLVFLLFWPYIPDEYKPDIAKRALRFVSWEYFQVAAVALISLIALLHLVTRIRLRRAIRRANSLLTRVLEHSNASGFLRDHIQIKNAILDALTQPSPEHALAAQTPKVTPHLDRMCRQIAAIFEEITGRKCHWHY